MIYPKHIAIIPDGNRTWATKNWLSVFEWYIKSIEVAFEHIKYIFNNTEIKVLSWRWMSTENLKKRPKEETDYLFKMYKICWDNIFGYMRDNKINFHWIGNPKWISEDFLAYLAKMQNELSFETDRYMVFAVNYGGRDEIIRWIQKYISTQNTESPESIVNNIYSLTDDDLWEYMDLGKLPNVELVIRTKWDVSSRTSGFMSWRIGYAELYFTDKLYQELDSDELSKALIWFDKINQFRNFGG